MSKFNKVSEGSKTENLAGGQGYKESSKLEFVSILLTSFVQDQFYRSETGTLKRIRELMTSIADKKFLAKAAIYTRTKFGMRSISHVVAGEIGKMVKGEQWTKVFFDKIVYRYDDLLEILAYIDVKNNPIPNAMKKGFRKAFNRFDVYALSKYRCARKEISSVDAVNLLHPRPIEKNADAVKKLMQGELKSIGDNVTWEARLSESGQKAESEEEKGELKKEAWKELILEKKMKYFGLLRNIRNILEQAPEILPQALEMLEDETLIKKSLVLPFRFTTAMAEIEKLSGKDARTVLMSLNRAVETALSNVPKFDGDTLVVLDGSGSMSGRPLDIGALFAAVLVKSNNADFITFSDTAKYLSLNPMDSLSTITKRLIDMAESGGTNFHAIFTTANRSYKRIIILSDMQGWMGYNVPTKEFNAYKKRYDCNPFIYSFDLAGYGTLEFPEKNVFALAGFSDKIFSVMEMLEQDKDALINTIESIEL